MQAKKAPASTRFWVPPPKFLWLIFVSEMVLFNSSNDPFVPGLHYSRSLTFCQKGYTTYSKILDKRGHLLLLRKKRESEGTPLCHYIGEKTSHRGRFFPSQFYYSTCQVGCQNDCRWVVAQEAGPRLARWRRPECAGPGRARFAIGETHRKPSLTLPGTCAIIVI